VADNNTPEGQAQNRRVELRKLGGDEQIHPPLFVPRASPVGPDASREEGAGSKAGEEPAPAPSPEQAPPAEKP